VALVVALPTLRAWNNKRQHRYRGTTSDSIATGYDASSDWKFRFEAAYAALDELWDAALEVGPVDGTEPARALVQAISLLQQAEEQLSFVTVS
jgi:hypothetical protein